VYDRLWLHSKYATARRARPGREIQSKIRAEIGAFNL
jgi:hypothetical protein